MSKRKVKVKANKLDNVDVEYISLVPRGANRMPFRLLKSEDPENSPMINLANLFKNDPLVPRFGGVLVKSADADAWKKTLEKEGYGPLESEATSDDGITFLKTEGAKLDGAAIVKTSEDLAVVVVDLEKGIVPKLYGDVPFQEAADSVSFMPSFHMATDVMINKMYEVVNDPGDREETLAKMDSLLSDFKTYVESMASALPVDIFKLEKLSKADEPDEEEDESEVEAEAEAEGGEEGGDEGETQDTGDTEGGEAEGEPVNKGDSAEGGNKEDGDLAKILATVTTLGDRMSALEDGLKKSDKDRNKTLKQVSAFQSALDGVVKTTETLHEAVTGTALSTPEADPEGDDKLRKSSAHRDDVFQAALEEAGKGIEIV